MKPITWIVRRSRFPLAAYGDVLGEVVATSRQSAERTASAEFGTDIVVERDLPAARKPVRTLTRRNRRSRPGRESRPTNPHTGADAP